jgi:hypothetical protein
MKAMPGEWTDRRLDDFAAHTDQRFDAVDKRFDAVDRRFDKVDARFDRMEAKIDHGFDQINARFDTMQQMLFGGAVGLTIGLLGVIATQL